VNTYSRGTIFSSKVSEQNMIAMEQNKNQRQPGPPDRRSSKSGRQDHTNKGRPERRNEPSARQDAEQDTNAAGHAKPITNQDEQRRATNAGNSNDVMGEQEIEGDRWRNDRSRPYINSNDFLSIYRKTPTME